MPPKIISQPEIHELQKCIEGLKQDPEVNARSLAILLPHIKKLELDYVEDIGLWTGELSRADLYAIFPQLSHADDDIWDLREEEKYPVPTHVVKALADFDAVIRCSKCKEALIRGRLNTILTCSLAAELAPSDNVMSPATPYFAEPLKLAFEKHREKKVMLDGKPRLLKGVCDYSLWYDSPDQLGTSLVVYEAKCEGYASNGVTQLLAYMAVVHTVRNEARKANSTVFGVSIDSTDFVFLKIDNDSRVYK